jgi:hypothetical protein
VSPGQFLRLDLAGTAVVALLGSQMAGANGTPAAANVPNTATVEDDVGDVQQNPQSASTSFVVARKGIVRRCEPGGIWQQI